MKKQFKKWTSGLLAAALISTMGLTAFAEDATSVTAKLTGKETAAPGDTISIQLEAEKNVGGMQGTVDYDESKVELDKISVTSEFAAANHIEKDSGENDLFNDDKSAVKFVLLSDNAESKVWITLQFKVKEDATESAFFDLKDVKVSNSAGTAYIDASETDDLTVKIEKPKLQMNGATVRKNGDPDIRFSVTRLDTTSTIEEVGVIMIPKALLDEGEVLEATKEEYGKDTKYKAKIAKGTGADLDTNTDIVANLVGTDSSKFFKQQIAARAYFKIEGEYYYTDNAIPANNIAGGTSVRSCAEVAKAIASAKNISIDDVNAGEPSTWSYEDYTAIIAKLADRSDADLH